MESLAKGMLILSQAQPMQISKATPLASSTRPGAWHLKDIVFSRGIFPQALTVFLLGEQVLPFLAPRYLKLQDLPVL